MSCWKCSAPNGKPHDPGCPLADEVVGMLGMKKEHHTFFEAVKAERYFGLEVDAIVHALASNLKLTIWAHPEDERMTAIRAAVESAMIAGVSYALTHPELRGSTKTETAPSENPIGTVDEAHLDLVENEPTVVRTYSVSDIKGECGYAALCDACVKLRIARNDVGFTPAGATSLIDLSEPREVEHSRLWQCADCGVHCRSADARRERALREREP